MASATQQAKKTTRNARTTADSAAKTAQVASEHAERNVRTLVRDSAYVTLGVGDLAVSIVRNFGEKAAELRAEAPNTIKSGVHPRQVSARVERRLERLRSGATSEYERLNERGRSLAEGIQTSSSTRKAFDQVGTARSQVKAATTSVTRASKLVGEAAEDSVEKVGDDTPVDYDAKNLEELKEMARQRDITGRSSMNRDELVEALQDR
jgi:hypothetical protein